MDIFVGVDTFFTRENQVWNFKVEITNFWSLFKPQILYIILQQGAQNNVLSSYVWLKMG